MELVTGFQGKNHVTARQVSRLIAGLATDGETYVLKTLDQLPAELLNVNTVSIGTGDIIADGTYFTVEAPEEITIENGVTGLNRNDLIVARYLKAEPAVDEDGVPDYTIPRVESGELAVVKGAPSSGDPDDPALVKASIYDDNTTLAEFPLYRIPVRGLSVGTPEPLFKILPPGAKRWDSLSRDVDAKTAFTGNRRITSTYSIGAGSYADAKFVIPDNLEVVSLCGYSSGNYFVAITQVEATNGSANMRLFNETNTQINNQTATVVVNCRARTGS